MSIRHVPSAHQDERGTIADVLEDELVEHITMITTRPGAVRGNHFHRETHQWVYIVSGALRCVSRGIDGIAHDGIARAGDVWMTGPMDAHAMEALEETVMVVMTRGPRGGREYESDTYRCEQPLIAAEVAA